MYIPKTQEKISGEMKLYIKKILDVDRITNSTIEIKGWKYQVRNKRTKKRCREQGLIVCNVYSFSGKERGEESRKSGVHRDRPLSEFTSSWFIPDPIQNRVVRADAY